MNHQQKPLTIESNESRLSSPSRRSTSEEKKRVRFNDQVETFVIEPGPDCDEFLTSFFSQSLPPMKSTTRKTIQRNEELLWKSRAMCRSSTTMPPRLFFPPPSTSKVPQSLLTRRWESPKDHLRDRAPTPAVRLNRLEIIDMALQITINAGI